MAERAGSAAEQAILALGRLVRERLARLPGGHLVEASLLEVELPIRLVVAADDPRHADAARDLDRLVERILTDAVQHAAAFRPGFVWCHRCGASSCEHASPASSRHVFAGYGPTGTPRWIDFAQLCLDQKHPEVDRLYDPAPALLTIVHGPAELESAVLAAFRAEHSEILGQVTAGFFAVPSGVEEGRAVVAVTAQVVASHGRRGDLRLGLNLLGRSPSTEPLDELWERHGGPPWRAGIRWAQSALAGLTRGRSGEVRRLPRAVVDRRVSGILAGLARRLEHDRRARSRRTLHAEERHLSGERPTRHAIADARAASDEALLKDERTGAIVVLGDRGRTHFFTTDGRLVSSVRYGRDVVERRIHAGLWRRATADQAGEFRRRVADRGERVGSGGDR